MSTTSQREGEPTAGRPGGLEREGLTDAEAARRLERDGPNELPRKEGPSIPRLLLAQVASPLILLLFAASAIAAALGEVTDAVAIAAILVLNALIGFAQEHRAERAVLALRSLTAPRARVLRDGRSSVIPAAAVVTGDVLLLEAGDLVAADARLLRAHRLSTNEAPLTGESAPVEKSSAAAAPGAPLAERFDHVFLGTAVATGTGVAEVVATGMRTELGRIAELLATAVEAPTPLQTRLAKLSQVLIVLCLGIVLAVAVLGVVRGAPLLDVLIASISLAVAAVPEGLPAVMTIALAIGVQRMARRHALVRRLHAVETLGTATVICTDKTGTLTTGSMEAREAWAADERALWDAAAACCDAELGGPDRPAVGDPTEIAILAGARKHGIDRTGIERDRPRVWELPFDSERKRMSVLRADGVLYVKGAPDLLLPLCSEGTAGAEEKLRELAARGLRVLGVATGRGRGESNLRLVGLLGLADPPRPEARAALSAARGAGIRTVMITGDHHDTAVAIAQEIGLLRPGEDAGDRVYARVTAERKLQLVRALRERGEVVAMTGDGVNDAPALREAHIGIAMGRTGSEVTREASDLVLADDNYATIVEAIREGRGIYANIQKAVVYLLQGNAGELFLMLAAVALGLPLPLLPLQILWVNLVSDGLPALALVMDPPAGDLLEQPPRKPSEPIVSRRDWRQIAAVALLEGGMVLAAFATALSEGLTEARDLAFTTLVFAELLRSFALRSRTRLFWEVGALGNAFLVAVVLATIGVQLLLHVSEPARALLGLAPLDAGRMLTAFALGLVPVTALELSKLVRRWRRGRAAR